MSPELIKLMLILSALIVASVIASKITSKFGIPILLIFILVGMFSGSDGVVGIYFDDANTAQTLGALSLILILFSGGLSTKVHEIKPILKEGFILSTMGVFLSTLLMGIGIHYLLDWNWLLSFLLGATISSTDAAAVFGVFRTSKIPLHPRMQSLLEFESGSNDPLAVFLTINLITIITQKETLPWSTLVYNLFSQMVLGAIFGWVLARGLVKLINLLDLEAEGLYPVLTLAGALSIFGLAEYCGGNGFLAVYIAGIAMGGEKYFSKKTLTIFHDGLSWIMQCIMFLMLGLLVFPSSLPGIMAPGILLTLLLMFIVRPLAAAASLICFNYSWREILFVSWGGLRGAVPVILATYSLVGGIKESHEIFNLVFFIVISSLLFQGMSLNWVAKILKVQRSDSYIHPLPFSSEAIHRDFIAFHIKSNSSLIGKSILELELPSDILIVLIKRGKEEFIPHGSSELQSQDQVICLSNQKNFGVLSKKFKE